MRKLTKKDIGKSISQSELQEFELRSNYILPGYFRNFLLEYNGSSVKENKFGTHSFTTFLPLKSTRSASIEIILEGYKSDLNTDKWLPFAIDSGGWVFVISLEEKTNGQVWIDKFDSGLEDPFEYLAPSFEDFLNALQSGDD